MVLRSTISAFLLLLLAVFAAAQEGRPTPGSAARADVARNGVEAPDANTIVARMMAVRQNHKAQVRGYTVKRNYELLDKQEQPKAEVVATITYRPPDDKQYNIESSSGGIGGKVLRDILQKETESSKDQQRKELSPNNYDFQLAGEEAVDGRNCYVLSINPKHEDKDMIRGKIWVDAQNYNIHRIEGKTVKSPSWWIRDLYILMTFTSVDGMWLHTFTHAVADVRFKGKYVMESRDVEYGPAESSTAVRRKNPGILAGAAINP